MFRRFFHAFEGHRPWPKVAKGVFSYFVNGLEGHLHFMFRLSWSSPCLGESEFYLQKLLNFKKTNANFII